MEVSGGRNSPWNGVVELTKAAQEKGSDPLVWAIQMYSNLNSAGESLPSVELAELLVSYICWDNNVPILWKFLDKALALKIVPPVLLLALLSLRSCLCSSFFLFLSLSSLHFKNLFSFFSGNVVLHYNIMIYEWVCLLLPCFNFMYLALLMEFSYFLLPFLFFL